MNFRDKLHYEFLKFIRFWAEMRGDMAPKARFLNALHLLMKTVTYTPNYLKSHLHFYFRKRKKRINVKKCIPGI